MLDEEQKDKATPTREPWEAPKLTIEDVGSVTRGGPFSSGPLGDDAWYSS